MKLLICDDHNLISEGIELMLQNSSEVFEIHIVNSGKAALQFLQKQLVAVLILDISMPEMDGLDVLDALNANELSVHVLMLTMHNEIEYIKKAMSKGAKGYILKNTSKEMLIDAIQKVAKGEIYVDSRLTSILIDDLTETPKAKKTSTVKLTPREIDILKLIAQNKTTKEIAEILFITVNTVQSHKKNLYSKLNIHSISELVTYAFQHGFVEI
ncbi:response regulator transcription factor [Kordia sp. YSTF-M3]|uniref:Response regulator transcription factor n=1 Tax=Kordia aestuariivivens TaxID=2759037 RepID=A0ABR7QFQ2_9FLAO|nr:response regulator transcription factor [Kordia aestuariivivens]MBC8757392.1 response regulator transcription factor [Kordia aestuariivivens]